MHRSARLRLPCRRTAGPAAAPGGQAPDPDSRNHTRAGERTCDPDADGRSRPAQERDPAACCSRHVDEPYSLAACTQCSQIVAAVEAARHRCWARTSTCRRTAAAASPPGRSGRISRPLRVHSVPRPDPRSLRRQRPPARRCRKPSSPALPARSFLKGVGQARNCAYPARPANAQIIAQQAAALMASLEVLCGPLPNGQKRTPHEEWLNSRKCAEYKRAKPRPQPLRPRSAIAHAAPARGN